MSVLVAVEWMDMICAGRTEAGKMADCRLSTAPAGGLLVAFPAGCSPLDGVVGNLSFASVD